MAIKDMQTVPCAQGNAWEDSKLKPCPFCGRPATMKKKVDTLRGDKYTARCSDTNCIGRIYRAYVTKEQAMRAWNRRVYANE